MNLHTPPILLGGFSFCILSATSFADGRRQKNVTATYQLRRLHFQNPRCKMATISLHKTQDRIGEATTNVHICSSRQPLHGVFGGRKGSKILTEEQRLQNFWIEADALSGVSYFDAVNAGLEPVKYHYPLVSKQRVSAQLNFKVWERSKLCCYFRCLDSGDYFKMNLFFNAKTGGHYASQQGSIDFKSSGLLGECFLLDIVISEKGYPILKNAKMLDDQVVL